MTAVRSPDWVRCYEDLRAHTLGSLAALQSDAWGLVVFVQQGMRGWMRAWQDPQRQAGDPAQPPPTPKVSLDSTPETTVLLTNMTLRCLGLCAL